eukprot:COSAG01_NODE_1945_length_8831_cov_4.250000_4_plen_159_part_00
MRWLNFGCITFVVLGLEARRPRTARAAKTGLRPSSPFGMQRAGPPVPVPRFSQDAKRNIAVHAAKLHRPPTKMVEPPPAPRAGAFRARKPAQTNFSKRYRCGDLPVSVDHGHSKPAIRVRGLHLSASKLMMRARTPEVDDLHKRLLLSKYPYHSAPCK